MCNELQMYKYIDGLRLNVSHNYKVPNCIEQVVQRILFSYFILGNTCKRGKYMYITCPFFCISNKYFEC